MMTKKIDAANIIQILEQAEAQLDSNARLMASYYQSFINAGMPEDLAKSLVKDYHEILIKSSFGNATE